MAKDPARHSFASDGGGLLGCLVFACLPLIWFIVGPFLPEQVFWFPFWVGTVILNGVDGQGGISQLLGS
ncbi:hypothetical protein ACIA9I_34440 [Streptomyces anulatus]